MLAYLKTKTNNEELYETNFLSNLKNKTTKISKIQFWACKLFFEGIVLLKYYANIITVKQIYNGYIFILPFKIVKQNINGRARKRKVQKCMYKVQKLMKKYKIQNLVVSEELKGKLNFKTNYINKKIHLLNGSGVKPYLIKEILEYIAEKRNEKTEFEDIYFCMKDIKKIHIENIKYLAKSYRSVNIVTPKINSFQSIADRIEKNENCILTVTNNKRKSLKKAKLIVNFDFKEDEIKQYTIYRTAIIVYIQNEGYFENVGFDGIQIREVQIETSKELKKYFNQNGLLNCNSLTTLYESIIDEEQKFSNIREKIEKDEIRVIGLYGINGEISERELSLV